MQAVTHEQTVLRIMRRLPPERVAELVDFANFLSALADKDHNETERDESAGDERWESLLAQPESKTLLRNMAREAAEDYRAGRTTDISVTKDGRLSPR